MQQNIIYINLYVEGITRLVSALNKTMVKDILTSL